MTQLSDKAARKNAVNVPPNYAPTLEVDDSLKGLLMDKGRDGLEAKIRKILRNIELVQTAMESLVEQQRYSRENAGCDCLDLYLAKNLKTGNQRVDAETIRGMNLRDIQIHYSKAAASLEWRARPTFSSVYGYRNTSRMYAFTRGHEHAANTREYVGKTVPNYYKVIAGYDAVKVSLNYAMRSLRKTLLDLHGLSLDVDYPPEVVRDAEKLSKRFFKQLPDSSAVAQVLNKLFC